MKSNIITMNPERFIAALALVFLLVAAQVYTQDASDWFLLGLNIIEVTGGQFQPVDTNQLPDVAKVGDDSNQWLLTYLIPQLTVLLK